MKMCRCKRCGVMFDADAKRFGSYSYCTAECFKRKAVVPCEECGVLVTLLPSQVKRGVFCEVHAANIAAKRKDWKCALQGKRLLVQARKRLRAHSPSRRAVSTPEPTSQD